MPCFHCKLPLTADMTSHRECILEGFKSNRFQDIQEYRIQSTIKILRRYKRVLPAVPHVLPDPVGDALALRTGESRGSGSG
jgi:hypothetical protein